MVGTVSLVYGKNQGIFKEYTGTDLKTLSENAKVLNDHHRKLLEMPARLAKWFNTADWVGYSSRLEQNLNACKYPQDDTYLLHTFPKPDVASTTST